jgi:RNA polymerase sigma factor (TIGR02999 family)
MTRQPDVPVAGGDVTRLLVAWREGDLSAPQELFTLLYGHLRGLARAQLARRRPGPTLSATALVHEAYLKLAHRQRLAVSDRRHFYAVAAKAMRQILLDHARRRGALKRGAGGARVTLDEAMVSIDTQAADVIALDAALARLEAVDPPLSRLVELRFYGGLSIEETAGAMGVSPRTAKREWQKARLFLYHRLSGHMAVSPGSPGA